MADIKTQKLIYHLTAFENLPSVLAQGLKPRSQLTRFHDVADQDIIQKRSTLRLENCVPFHWFVKNPFDGSVQTAHRNKPFALICVRREVAARNNWSVIPRHPLANAEIELLNYEAGFAAIDWETMNKRDYHDSNCKSVCMAECLAPGTVPVSQFCNIYVRTSELEKKARAWATQQKVTVYIDVNENMFLR
ncbi:hypothetical protein MIZ03_1176 [Rhodoferax lithotrophicus]|uniref:DarT domain-containing protein n=1 Tax=Rhodoferax lithotrophicus TaxID=2798804 RepID=A0ABM7MJE7_9BURK|nr:DarT ssDNA thymidine ADP-ribosyltransferase family protein [Rhodoferax sp. MIZ03]BCO26296.1 hypothetical protein MIZ03_1176 [Rhodoferax sp. MIZ03]